MHSPAEPSRRRPLRGLLASDYTKLALAFVATRAALYAAGLRFKLVLDWMFLADVADLRDQLLRTAYYFHAFPPGMNLLTGWLLKLSEAHVSELAHAVFLASGLLLLGSLYYLARAVGLPRWLAMALSLAFSLTPPTLYFENLYLYDYPVPALLTFAAALFHRAVTRNTFKLWLALFGVCAVLGILRSALHLIWFVAIIALSLWLMKEGRRRILLAAAGPAALLLALYSKNYLLFGVFDSQSQSGGNFILITTYHMPRDLRQRWVHEGKLSPFGAMGFAAPPRDFLPYFEHTENPRWPEPELNRLERRSSGAPDYNHWFFLEVNRKRREDARFCLSERPQQYIDTVLYKSLPQAFSPSTLWHPFTNKRSSPHYAHRQVLGRYEQLYNYVLHQAFLAPVGVYALLPATLGWVALRGVRRLRSGSTEGRAEGAVWYFFLIQIGYLISITALLTWGENARYRYIVEPFIWLVMARSLFDLAVYAHAAGRRLIISRTREIGRAGISPRRSQV